MNKIALLILCFVFLSPASILADDFFDNYTGVDNAWEGQTPITNKEFEQAIDTLTAKQKKKEERTKKRKIRKISGGGTSLHNALEPTGEIMEQDALKDKDKYEGQLLNIPVDVIIDGKILQRGFYNVFGEKDKNNQIYLSFYQAHTMMGKIKAYQTNNDFNADELDFVKIQPYDNMYIKVMYGSLDFNAYTYLEYLPPEQFNVQ